MIANSPTLLHPMDNLKVLADGLPLNGSITFPPQETVTVAPQNTPITGSSFNYVQTICNKCRKIAPITGPMIEGIIVCQPCYDEHRVMDNTLKCPYKDPSRRKYKIKAKSDPLWSYTTRTTQANT